MKTLYRQLDYGPTVCPDRNKRLGRWPDVHCIAQYPGRWPGLGKRPGLWPSMHQASNHFWFYIFVDSVLTGAELGKTAIGDLLGRIPVFRLWRQKF